MQVRIVLYPDRLCTRHKVLVDVVKLMLVVKSKIKRKSNLIRNRVSMQIQDLNQRWHKNQQRKFYLNHNEMIILGNHQGQEMTK